LGNDGESRVDGYTETLNQTKILLKTQKDDTRTKNLLKTY